MNALKMTSQEHQGPRRVIYSCQKVVIINYSLISHVLHRSIIMHRRRHIASAAPAIITVVCTSALPRVVTKCGLTIVLSCSGTLCSIFHHSVVISLLTFPGHSCHHPRPHTFTTSSCRHQVTVVHAWSLSWSSWHWHMLITPSFLCVVISLSALPAPPQFVQLGKH